MILPTQDLEGITSLIAAAEGSSDQFLYSRLMPYIFPPSARLDDSPLFTLCYNDTCSYTWTGPNHIQQDIFECRTCGLMNSLCCCAECARVCHKGHDCRLKRTSPTAYCDCWEKCRCRSLVLGHQATRLELFKRLLYNTDLVYLPNGAGEHLMVYLTRSDERKAREQKQYKPSRRRAARAAMAVAAGSGGGEGASPLPRSTASGRTATGGSASAEPNEPEHDLEPPTFSRDALGLVFDSKAAAASLLCDSRVAGYVESLMRYGKSGKIGGYVSRCVLLL